MTVVLPEKSGKGTEIGLGLRSVSFRTDVFVYSYRKLDSHNILAEFLSDGGGHRVKMGRKLQEKLKSLLRFAIPHMLSFINTVLTTFIFVGIIMTVEYSLKLVIENLILRN